MASKRVPGPREIVKVRPGKALSEGDTVLLPVEIKKIWPNGDVTYRAPGYGAPITVRPKFVPGADVDDA